MTPERGDVDEYRCGGDTAVSWSRSQRRAFQRLRRLLNPLHAPRADASLRGSRSRAEDKVVAEMGTNSRGERKQFHRLRRPRTPRSRCVSVSEPCLHAVDERVAAERRKRSRSLRHDVDTETGSQAGFRGAGKMESQRSRGAQRGSDGRNIAWGLSQRRAPPFRIVSISWAYFSQT